MTTAHDAEVMEAARSGNLDALRQLLPPAGDPKAIVGPDGITPLMAAAAGGHEAAVEFLLEHGADPDDVRPEVQARNTHQNLVLSAAVQQQAGRPGPVVAVTNNYHVLRTAVLARRIGSDTQVVGSPTARYYVPSAFLREFVAVVVEHRRLHLLLVVPFAALIVVGMVAASAGR